MTEAEIQKIVTAARDLLRKIEIMAPNGLARASTVHEREALWQALGAAV